MKKTIPANFFKTKCLEIIDEVQKMKRAVIISKRGKPIAQLIPIEEGSSLFGKMKGTIHIKSDIIQPIEENWNVCSLNEFNAERQRE